LRITIPLIIHRAGKDSSREVSIRAWLDMRTEEASQVLLGPDQLAGERAALAVLKLERVHTSDVMLSLLASEQNSRDANQSVFTPASRLNVRTTSLGIEKILHDGPSWSLVHSRNEFVEPGLAMLRACVQSPPPPPNS
jgi:hypothetical protein